MVINVERLDAGGHDAFEQFAKAYVAHFKYNTLTTADFKTFFLGWCSGRGIDASAVDWVAWLTAPVPHTSIASPHKGS
jgi:hypothetical protein